MSKTNVPKPAPAPLVIEFANARAREAFAVWLCESGEQAYWRWMEVNDDGTGITAVEFRYHGPKKRPGEFIADGIIRTKLGKADQ